MNLYLLFKSLHLISVISWMAGLLYLPRIFVYHSQNNHETKTSEIFKVMEKKLFFYIMTPAMILSWIFGLGIIHFQGAELLQAKWFIFKILAVLILTGYHFYLGRCLRLFSQDLNSDSPKFFRVINEIPTILLILTVFIVIFKPI
mgnify:CR=1 FL=1